MPQSESRDVVLVLTYAEAEDVAEALRVSRMAGDAYCLSAAQALDRALWSLNPDWEPLAKDEEDE